MSPSGDQVRGLFSRPGAVGAWIYVIFSLEATLLGLGLFHSATLEIALMDMIALAIAVRVIVTKRSIWSNAAAIGQFVALLSLLVSGPKGLIVMGTWFAAHLTTLAALTLLLMEGWLDEAAEGPIPQLSGRDASKKT